MLQSPEVVLRSWNDELKSPFEVPLHSTLKQMEDVHGKLSQHVTSSMISLETLVTDLSNDIDGHTSRLSTTESNLAELSDNLTRIEHNAGTVSTVVSGLQETVEKNGKDIETLNVVTTQANSGACEASKLGQVRLNLETGRQEVCVSVELYQLIDCIGMRTRIWWNGLLLAPLGIRAILCSDRPDAAPRLFVVCGRIEVDWISAEVY